MPCCSASANNSRALATSRSTTGSRRSALPRTAAIWWGPAPAVAGAPPSHWRTPPPTAEARRAPHDACAGRCDRRKRWPGSGQTTPPPRTYRSPRPSATPGFDRFPDLAQAQRFLQLELASKRLDLLEQRGSVDRLIRPCRHELGHRLAVPGDGHFLAGFRPLDELGKPRFRLVDAHSFHFCASSEFWLARFYPGRDGIRHPAKCLQAAGPVSRRMTGKAPGATDLPMQRGAGAPAWLCFRHGRGPTLATGAAAPVPRARAGPAAPACAHGERVP